MKRLLLIATLISACNASGSGPTCRPANVALPPDASVSEQAGIGRCCVHDSDCGSNAICPVGRCCFGYPDSGRRCHANSDCCSGQCSCGDACDQHASGGGTCSEYMR